MSYNILILFCAKYFITENFSLLSYKISYTILKLFYTEYSISVFIANKQQIFPCLMVPLLTATLLVPLVSAHPLQLRQWLPISKRYAEEVSQRHPGQQHRSNDFLAGSMVDDDANDVEDRLTSDTIVAKMVLRSLMDRKRELAAKNTPVSVSKSDERLEGDVSAFSGINSISLQPGQTIQREQQFKHSIDEEIKKFSSAFQQSKKSNDNIHRCISSEITCGRRTTLGPLKNGIKMLLKKLQDAVKHVSLIFNTFG